MNPPLDKLPRLSRKTFLRLLGLGLILSGLYYLRKMFFPLGIEETARFLVYRSGKSIKILEELVDVIAPTQVRVKLANRAIVEKVVYKSNGSLSNKVLPIQAVYLLNSTAEELYKEDFSNLSHSQKKEVLSRALKSPSDARHLLFSLREEVMKEYYGSGPVWMYLRLENPPQPYGYMDYDKRPGKGI